MDPETFEDVILDEGLIKDAKDFLVETQAYSILHVDDKPISIDYPHRLK